jgi:hypothetical protein
VMRGIKGLQKRTKNFNGRRNPLSSNGVNGHPPYTWYRNGIETVGFWLYGVLGLGWKVGGRRREK